MILLSTPSSSGFNWLKYLHDANSNKKPEQEIMLEHWENVYRIRSIKLPTTIQTPVFTKKGPWNGDDNQKDD
jgi:hypothetical protein